jgi:hypothetical protein
MVRTGTNHSRLFGKKKNEAILVRQYNNTSVRNRRLVVGVRVTKEERRN